MHFCAPGVVLMPGQLLPLWLLRRSELQTAEAALAAPKPLDRLLVVVSASSEHMPAVPLQHMLSAAVEQL